jgi:hypothetical protein
MSIQKCRLPKSKPLSFKWAIVRPAQYGSTPFVLRYILKRVSRSSDFITPPLNSPATGGKLQTHAQVHALGESGVGAGRVGLPGILLIVRVRLILEAKLLRVSPCLLLLFCNAGRANKSESSLLIGLDLSAAPKALSKVASLPA